MHRHRNVQHHIAFSRASIAHTSHMAAPTCTHCSTSELELNEWYIVKSSYCARRAYGP